MMNGSDLILPLDPTYSAHRDQEKRLRETREWLERREKELGFFSDAPSVSPGQFKN